MRILLVEDETPVRTFAARALAERSLAWAGIAEPVDADVVSQLDPSCDHRIEVEAAPSDRRPAAPQQRKDAPRVRRAGSFGHANASLALGNRIAHHAVPYTVPYAVRRRSRPENRPMRPTAPTEETASMTTLDTIRLRGVRQHNLRGFDLDLAKRTLVVVVGVSGSGKSSLVFDTIAAEAQRQINSTFTAFAQTYLPSYGRPDADRIENLSAAVIIDQRRLTGGPRSTLATITDIGDWMRLLWARGVSPSIGYSNAFSANDPAGMCPRCQGLGVEKVVDVDAFVDASRSLREGPFRHPDYRPGKLAWRRYADSGLFDVDVPVEQYSARELHLLLHAEPGEVEPCVGGYTLFDVNVGYRLPGFSGATIQLAVQNLFDESYRSFPGVPEIGRMALLRLRYEF